MKNFLRSRISLLCYTCLLTFLTLATSVDAATYYVAKTGSNSNAGTSSSPWLTVQKAANSVAAGDTVNVAAGTYAEKVTISKSGTSSAKISFVANGSVTVGGFYVMNPYVTLTGFNCNGTAVDANDAAITYYYNAHYGEVRNCSTSGFTGIVQGAGGVYLYSDNCIVDGITMTNPNFHALILIGKNNLVKNFAITMATGWDVVRVVGSNATIQDGTISASNPGELNTNHCDIFQTFGDDPNTVCQDVIIERVYVSNGQGYQFGNITDDQENGNISRWTFRNNTFVDVERVVNHYAPDCSYLNNTFVRCGSGSGWVISIGSSGAGRSNNLTIKNNIFYQCGYASNPFTGWYAGDSVTGTVADYNLVVGTGLGTVKNLLSWLNGIGGIIGNFEAHGLNGIDPQFVNPAAGDYNLRSGSPATGMGASFTSTTPPPTTPPPTSGTACWVMGNGDSILMGYASSNNTTKNPIALMAANFPAVTFVNKSVNGAQIAANASASVALADLAAATATGNYAKYTIILEFGINDIATNDSAANIQANLTTWITNVRAAYPGAKIIGSTLHYVNFGGLQSTFEPRRQAVNTWMRSWTVANGRANGYDAVCDIAADSRLGTNFANTSYYYTDQVHLTDAGYAVWAGLMQATLQAKGLLTAGTAQAPMNALVSISIR